MKILYFDCPTGISGDMCVASLIDLGADINRLKKELKKLPLSGHKIEVAREKRHAITGIRFKVRTLVDLPNREGRLRAALERLGSEYDFILKTSIAIFR